MEEEEKEANSAKLQELIRRGTPHDLQEANRLMKVMAGFDTRSKTDYRAKAAEDISKIQAKARLLEERLEAFKPGDEMKDGDVFSELASSLQNAQPKIQKMCEEESDDHEAVAKLFEINDSIHRTVERYRLMKKGDMEGAAKVAREGPAPSQTTTIGNNPGELSLIDFDTEPDTNGSSGQAGQSSQPAGSSSQASGLENDLLGLDIGGDSANFGQGGALSLGFGANQNVPGPALLSSLTEDSTAQHGGSAPTPPQSNFAAFSTPPGSQSMTPQPPNYQNPSPAPAAAPQPAVDPFAALTGGVSAQPAPAPAPTPVAAPPQPTVSNEEDEWNFASALPPEAPGKPKEHRLTVSNTNIRINMLAGRGAGGPNALNIKFAFTNNTASPVSELHFQLAVTKVRSHQRGCGSALDANDEMQGYELQLKPQTGRALAPKQSNGVTQEVDIWHAGNHAAKVEGVKMRWRATYKVGTEAKSEMGEVPEFSIA